MKTFRHLMIIGPAVVFISTSIALGQMMEKGSEGDTKKCPQMEKTEMMQGMGDMMSGMGHENMAGMHKGIQSGITKILKNEQALNLDMKQVEKLRSLDSATRRDMTSKKADIDVANLDLSVLLESPDSKIKDIEKLVKKISSLEADLRIKEIRASREAFGLLNLEQQSEYNEIKDKKTCDMMSGMMGMSMDGKELSGEDGEQNPQHDSHH